MSAAVPGRAQPPATFRCATAARGRDDPLPGSAPQVRGWLLLEHPGPWPVDAIAGSGIEPAVLQSLQQAADRSRVRILLVRRPGRSVAGPPRRWRLVWLGTGEELGGRWGTDGDLGTAVAALADGPPREPAGRAGALILVCTHGVHDACCAIRGRPVAAALARRWPDQVWECSHVGGDRFAPNVVVLPDGFYYGNLDPRRAVDVVTAHLNGRVATEALRGLAAHPPAVQAAVIAAHERFGPLAPTDITVLRDRHHAPAAGQPAQTEVELAVAGVPDPVGVLVRTLRRPEEKLTCRAIRSTPASEYQVGFHRVFDRPGFRA